MYLFYKIEQLKIVQFQEVPNTFADIFSLFPKLIEIESKDVQNQHYTDRITKHSLHVLPQTQWEIRKIHDSVEALLQDLSPRTGRSILYELTDDELSQLLQHIQTALQNVSPIIERDRWTIWSAMKFKEGSLTK